MERKENNNRDENIKIMSEVSVRPDTNPHVDQELV